MEAEYGRYFLKNFHLAPWARTIAPLQTRAAPQVPETQAWPDAGHRAVASTQVAPPAPQLGRPPALRLAPPPAPAPLCALGSESQVVVIETLREAVVLPEAAAEPEEYLGNGAMLSDDEEMLLGDGTSAPAPAINRKLKSDDVDSDSETEKAGEPSPEEAAPSPQTPPPSTSAAEMSPSPSPPGGEAPLPLMPTPLPHVPEASCRQCNQQPCACNRSQPAASQPQAASLSVKAEQLPRPEELPEMDRQVEERLDRFFQEESVWSYIEEEVLGTLRTRDSAKAVLGVQYFRIQVPSPYPGVQYRKSRKLEDRYKRYAKQGQTVEGIVEEDGEWLRINDKVFLPMKVGFVDILQPISKEEREAAVEEQLRLRKTGEQSPESPSELPNEEGPPPDPEGSFRLSMKGLPESISKAPLQDPQALHEFYTQNPINALGDTPRLPKQPWGQETEGGDLSLGGIVARLDEHSCDN
ncbi:unnamed protein product [Effrenium voratum]|nr:unnamed protein product [Effrenium voratum]